MSTDLLTLDLIAQNPTLVTQTIHLNKTTGSEKSLFRPLLHNDIFALQQFLECLSERTRRFATYPSYDLQCAQTYYNEINQNETLQMVAITENGKIIALFEFNFHLVEFDIKRYRKYGIELNQDSDIQFAPCIMDKHQNQHLAKRLGKKRIIAWAGVLIDNEQAIRFYEKNNFQISREKYIAEDGYECYDGILQLS
ncbi:unnamed protein product [Rotaria sordida]|uniref:N-acetyltransferase domain-containing protein n=1 Tax=Rotaria sordida TaxID=392033 RepID=A0A819D4V5_9BILA|nr:unnamed protein product [Rotaria sordida]